MNPKKIIERIIRNIPNCSLIARNDRQLYEHYIGSNKDNYYSKNWTVFALKCPIWHYQYKKEIESMIFIMQESIGRRIKISFIF